MQLCSATPSPRAHLDQRAKLQVEMMGPVKLFPRLNDSGTEFDNVRLGDCASPGRFTAGLSGLQNCLYIICERIDYFLYNDQRIWLKKFITNVAYAQRAPLHFLCVDMLIARLETGAEKRYRQRQGDMGR